MLNKEIVEVYLNSYRNNQRIRHLLLARGLVSESSVSKDVINWVKQFTRRWGVSHGRERFYKKNQVWLNQTFQVSILVVFWDKI